MSKSPKTPRSTRFRPLNFVNSPKSTSEKSSKLSNLVSFAKFSDLNEKSHAVVEWKDENKSSVVDVNKIFTEDKDSDILVGKSYFIKFSSSVYRGKILFKGKI